MSNEKQDQKEKLLKLVHDAVEQDKALREQFGIGEKFRFIRDRLQAIVNRVEKDLSELKVEITSEKPLSEDEMLVYVYLYNAQGLNISTWQKMLMPSVFYEHSINRPIYSEKKLVDAFIRSRINKMQHGYLTVAVKKSDIMPQLESVVSKDAIGNELIRVREGSLKAENLRTFTHNHQEYILNEDGVIAKKNVMPS